MVLLSLKSVFLKVRKRTLKVKCFHMFWVVVRHFSPIKAKQNYGAKVQTTTPTILLMS